MKLTLKLCAAVAVAVLAVAGTRSTALAESGCSQPWLNIYCDSTWFYMCVNGECNWNEIILYGVKDPD